MQVSHFTQYCCISVDILRIAVNWWMNERHEPSFFLRIHAQILLQVWKRQLERIWGSSMYALRFYRVALKNLVAEPNRRFKSVGPLNGYKQSCFVPRATTVWILPRLIVPDRALFAHDASYWISWLSWRAASCIGEDNDRSMIYVNAFCLFRHGVVTKSRNVLESAINRSSCRARAKNMGYLFLF